jgi:hypothetical protein
MRSDRLSTRNGPVRARRGSCTVTWVLALALAPAVARGQIDFVAVDVAANPDQIYYVDLANPGSANPAAPLAVLAGNYVRGMELTAETTGWYFCSNTLGGSPTGFFRLEDGVSTLVSPWPITYPSHSPGGMAFCADEQCLYVLASSAIQYSPLLYRVSLSGVFTLVGPVNMIFPVPLVAIGGAAVDPLTGVLYALEIVSGNLVTVDTMTGAATLVGWTGVPTAGTAGLDFAMDGTNRLFLAAPLGVYEINPVTGAWVTFHGNLPAHTSSLAAIPGRTTLKGPTLGLGQSGAITLSGGPPGAVFALYAASSTVWWPLPPHGVVRLDYTSPWFLEVVPPAPYLDPTGAASIPVSVPNWPALAGTSVPLQGFTIAPGGPTPILTNLASIRIL